MIDLVTHLAQQVPLSSPSATDPSAGVSDAVREAPSRLSIFEGYVAVLAVSFVVSLLMTPIMRRIAVWQGIIDRPSDPRKIHRVPIAYLGGVAVFVAIMAGIFYSYLGVRFEGLIDFHSARADHLTDSAAHAPVPFSILLGMTVILLVGVIDDVTGISPRVKIGGQLFAAAALAIDNVGVRLAKGLLQPFGNIVGHADLIWTIQLPFTVPGISTGQIQFDLVYWTGTAIIGLAVLAMCNASNLIDGLDGLLSGTTAISSIGLLVIALGMALADDGPRDAQRIVICLAVLGACLGFLPHNFNPASIFLGDAGSLLLGYCMCVIILTLGDTGRTHLVAAGLIIYAVPIIDTSLAIVRRKLERRSISSADDQHLHHMLKRALGVKGAALALYALAGCFALLGAASTMLRARVVYVFAMLLAAFVGVTAIKIARRRVIEAQAAGNAGAPTDTALSARTLSEPATTASSIPAGSPTSVRAEM